MPPDDCVSPTYPGTPNDCECYFINSVDNNPETQACPHPGSGELNCMFGLLPAKITSETNEHQVREADKRIRDDCSDTCTRGALSSTATTSRPRATPTSLDSPREDQYRSGRVSDLPVTNLTTKNSLQTVPITTNLNTSVGCQPRRPATLAYPVEHVMLQSSSPLSPMERQASIIKSIWPDTTDQANQRAPQFCARYRQIKAHATPNYLGAKIPVESGLNIIAWEAALATYHDNIICQYLKYGWPLGYHRAVPPVSVEKNHPSADHHMSHVTAFVEKELSFGALLGPFSSPPFSPWLRCSPIMTRPKKDSAERRVIVDLTFPEGEGVNAGIDTHDYYGIDITYTLPTISDLVTLLQREGRGALVWKADLARA